MFAAVSVLVIEDPEEVERRVQESQQQHVGAGEKGGAHESILIIAALAFISSNPSEALDLHLARLAAK